MKEHSTFTNITDDQLEIKELPASGHYCIQALSSSYDRERGFSSSTLQLVVTREQLEMIAEWVEREMGVGV